MDDFNRNDYANILARYTEKQLVYEYAIVRKEENIIYNKKRALDEEFKKRLEGE